jgi:FAD/FMN-containing dehydrogenase
VQVKSGGHSANPGFSSTKGIQIYTGKFSQVTYDAASGTAVIGTGLIWDNVYQQLQAHNVNVLGGRVTGVSGRDYPPLV